MNEDSRQISGSVERITFYNEENGFTVLELACDGELVCVVGCMPMVSPGEELDIIGRFDMHPSYGLQFRAEACQRRLPVTAAAILKYLSGGAIKGIGPSTAAKLVDRFGDKTLEIIECEPERLAEVSGISPAKAKKIYEDYLSQFGVREVTLFLSQFGVTPDQALRVYKVMGQGCVDKIRANPFFLCGDEISLPFEQVDIISNQLGFSNDFTFRVEAGIEYVLRHNLGNGHTCLPRDRLVERASALLGLETDEVNGEVEHLISAARLAEEKIDGRSFVYLAAMHRAESFCAATLLQMMQLLQCSVIGRGEIDALEKAQGIAYAERQRQAIELALSRAVTILTGGPGTGKTTTLRAIITLFEKHGIDYILAAPTGRAAKRMSEVTDREAKTIHRLLEVEWRGGTRPVFTRNEHNPLECKAIIVDEMSMVDIMLFQSLLKALPLGCRLIMVGDSDQLPSVSAGNVLDDMIESGAVPTVALDKVFRQAMQSTIVTNAHKIIDGEYPDLERRDSDFFFMDNRSPSSAVNLICDLCARRLPDAYGYGSDNIQVLCPSRKRDTGTVNLNNALQNRLNPPSPDKRQMAVRGFILREGDKVMQIKNNYDIEWYRDDGTQGVGTFNGDVGVLTEVDPVSEMVVVRYEDRYVGYCSDDLDQLELAYAVTVHKSQGSEFDCVIIPVLDMPPQLKYRNLLYTAVTRAREKIILVGSEQTVHDMVDNNKRVLRYTSLDFFLRRYSNG